MKLIIKNAHMAIRKDHATKTDFPLNLYKFDELEFPDGAVEIVDCSQSKTCVHYHNNACERPALVRESDYYKSMVEQFGKRLTALEAKVETTNKKG